jgi:hypothetical protein
MNDGPRKLYTGYLVEGLELSIRKVAYTKYSYDAAVFVLWSNYISSLMLGQYLEIDYDHFFHHLFKFIIDSHSSIQRFIWLIRLKERR